MTESLIAYLFLLTVVLTISWFYRTCKSKMAIAFIILWSTFQAYMGWSGFYNSTDEIPPRIMLFGVFPALVIILFTFISAKGRLFIDNLNLKTLTAFHTIRIPVEIVLLMLYNAGLVSVYMTFEGTNFDILSGLSAPLIVYLAWKSNKVNYKLLMIWNIICLLLLANVVITAIFAIPSPFQKYAFDQPNIAMLQFPFNLLPTVVVPLVLFGHLAAFRILKTKQMLNYK